MRVAHARVAIFSAAIVLAGALAACGGGGSGGGGGGGGGGGVPPTSPPTPTASPGASGTASVNGTALANANIVYSCGCSGQAGTTTADASGNFTLTASATAVPASPNPTYTMLPGRNYVIVGANSGTHAEAWTMFFLGNQPSHNVYMGSGGADTTDTATTAAALYVFYNAQNQGDTAFDDWNFNTVAAWAAELRSSPKTTAEQKFMSDINAAEASGTPLYPVKPAWDNDVGAANATIISDIEAITPASDSAVPTPCPLNNGSPSCTGAPNP